MKRLFAAIFALIILLSNDGLTMVTHYCNGKAVKHALALQQSNLDCGMNLKKDCQSDSKHAGVKKTACCQNTYLQISHDAYEFFSETVFQQNDKNAWLDCVDTKSICHARHIQLKQTELLYSVPKPKTDLHILYLSLII